MQSSTVYATAPADYNTWFTVANIQAAGITDQAFAKAVFDSITNTTTGIGGGTMPGMGDHLLNPYDWPPSEAAASSTDPPRITSYTELMTYINDPVAARTALEKTRMLLNWFSGKINASNKGIKDINGISLLQNANAIDLSHNMIEDLTPLAADKTDPPMFSGHINIEDNPIHRMPAWMGGTIHADILDRGSKWVVVSDITTRFRFGDTSEATITMDVQNTSGTGNVWEVGQSDPLIDDKNQQDVDSTVSIDTVDPNLRALTIMGKMSQENTDGTGAIGLYKTAMLREPRDGINSFDSGNIQFNSVIYSYQILTRLYSAVKDTANTEFLGGFTFTKTDAANTATVLPGAVYKLYDEDGNEVTTRYIVTTNGAKTEVPITSEDLTTDASCKFTVKYLPAGNYTLVEQTAPEGYKLDATAIPVSVLTGANTPPAVTTGTIGGIASFNRTGSTVSTVPQWAEPGYFFDGIYYTKAELTADVAAYTAAQDGSDLFMVNKTAGGWTGDATHSTLKYNESLQAEDYKIITRLKGELTAGGNNYKQNSSVTITMENLKAAGEGVANGTYPDLETAKAATNTVVTKTSLAAGRLQINQWANNNQITGDITIVSNTVYTLNDARFASASQQNVAVRKLTVSKTITSGDVNKDFTFTVKLTDAADAPLSGSYTYTGNGGAADGTLTLNADGEATVTLKHGQSITIANITAGSKYIVTETGGGTGWSTTVPATGNSFDGTLDENATAAFVNAYKPEPDDLSVPDVTKTISGGTPVTTTTFTYTLKAGNLTFPMPLGSTDGEKTITSSGAAFNAQFGDIAFTEAGIYTYTITEKAESARGYTYDRTKYTWTVTVIDNGGNLQATGALESDVQGAANPVTEAAFDNAYNPTAHPYVVPTVTKSITGGHNPGTEQTFTYTLTQTSGADTVMPDGSTGTTKTVDVIGANTAVFGQISYTGHPVGTYEYTIAEVIPAQQPHGYTYNPSNTEYHISVTVTDTGGELYVQPVVTKVVNGVDQPDVNPATMFENEYAPDADTFNPAVIKNVTGQDRPAEKSFDFELTRITADAPLPVASVGDTATVQITGNGNTGFGDITYDRAGEYQYSITEKAPSPDDAGYTYDETRYILTVTVTDTAGVLDAVGEIVKFGDTTPTAASFTNNYTPTPTILPLSVTKTVTGIMPALHTFEFTVERTDGGASGVIMPNPAQVTTEAIQTGSANPEHFGNIGFTAAGDYTFTVTETNDGIGGMSYAAPQTLHVKVTDNNGILTAQYVDGTGAAVPDGDKLSFTNTYTPTPDTLPLSVTKTVAGSRLPAAQSFEFALAIDAGDPTGVTLPNPAVITTDPVAEGSAPEKAFDIITFTAAGDYTFTVTETPSGITGMTDAAQQSIYVKVTDNNGILNAQYVNTAGTAEANGDKLTFTNTYTPTPTTLPLSATKTIAGDALTAAETFDFILTADAANPDGASFANPSTITTEPITTGSANPVSFGGITFNASGTYTFTVTEKPSGITGMTDAAPQTVRVIVTDANGVLSAQYVDAANAAVTDGDKLTFINTYAYIAAPASNLPNTGDSSGVWIYVLLMIAALGGIVGIYLYLKRHKNK